MADKGYWAVIKNEAGPIGEKTKCWMPGEVPTRAARVRKSDLRKLRQNENNANRRVARLIHANWPMGSGVLFELDYSPEGILALTGGEAYDPQDESRWDTVLEEAKHQLSNSSSWVPTSL